MKYTVDTDELATWADDLNSFDGKCERVLSEVDELVAELHLHWEGEAADAQRDNHQRWVKDLEAMREAVAEIKKRAKSAHTNYQTIVTTNQRMWNF